MLIKLSPEQVTKISANDPAAALVKISTLIDGMNTPATPAAQSAAPAATEPVTSSVQIKELATKILAMEEQISSLSASMVTTVALAGLETKVLAEAKTISMAEGSRAACAALAATGTNPLRASVVEETNASAPDKLEAAGKFEEQWSADKNLQAEFPTAGSYAGYMRAVKGGHVSIN